MTTNSTRGGDDLRLIILLGGVLAVLFLKGLPTALPAVPASPAADEFSATRAVERLTRILGDERPHSVDTDANDAVRERLIAEIEALGFAPEVRDDFACRSMLKWGRIGCARVRNVLFRAGPEGAGAVMLASHYDSVPAGPGAGDDGVGVAVSLEIAKLLADAPPAKPVLFLITDGEESGLIGARSFVEGDPLKDDVASVISIEARGVKGPGVMFETGAPNSGDIFAFAKGAPRPVSNSMMTDIYKLLPNDTDVTEYLTLDIGAINMALNDGAQFYHTPHDNLETLDPRSVQHIGEQALGSVRAYHVADSAAQKSNVIFTDILSRVLIVMPQWLGVVLVIGGLLAAVFAFAQDRGPNPIRALLTPLVILVLAGSITYALQAAAGALRPEELFWFAYPLAIQATAYLSALLAVAVAYWFIASGVGRNRLLHASWFWFAAIGAAAYFIAPGASILFALPLAVYVIAVLAANLSQAAVGKGFSIAATLLMLIIFAPLLYMTEIGLGFAIAAVSAVAAAVIAMLAAPFALRETNRTGSAPAAATGILLAFSFGAVLVVPAYSSAQPRPLNIQYYVDMESREAQWLIASTGGPAPAAMQAVAPFARADIEGFAIERLAARAPFLEYSAPEIMVLEDEVTGDGRRLHIALIGNGADQIILRLPEEARAQAISANGRALEFSGDGAQRLFCYGRACDGAEFEVTLRSSEPSDWLVFSTRFGLPVAAAALVSARPDNTTPIQNGDVTVVRVKKTI